MTSRLLCTCFLAVSLLCAASCATSPDTGKTSDFFQDSISREILKVGGDVQRICSDTLGYAYPQADISWQQLEGSRVWELATSGKHGAIVSQFEISSGKIVRSTILSSRESRGRQIKSASYLRQFSGTSLSDKGELNRQVDGITGATVSSKAVETAALLALRLDASVPDKQ